MKPSGPHSHFNPKLSTCGERSRRGHDLLPLIKTSDLLCSVWSAADYGAILDHQLDACVHDDADAFLPAASRTVRHAARPTFRDILLSPAPLLSLLRAIKEFARSLHGKGSSGYPEDVALALYFATLAAADHEGKCPISKLPSNERLEGYVWAMDQKWLPADLRDLFRRAAEDRAPPSKNPST